MEIKNAPKIIQNIFIKKTFSYPRCTIAMCLHSLANYKHPFSLFNILKPVLSRHKFIGTKSFSQYLDIYLIQNLTYKPFH